MDERTKRWTLLAGGGLVICIAVASWALMGESEPLEASNTPEDRVDRLGKDQSEESRDELVKLAASPKRTIALSAVRNLGLRGDEESRRALETVLADPERDSRVRSAAAATLGRFETLDPKPLTRILANEEDVHVRRGAARGLMKWTSTENNQAVPDLYEALRDPDVRVREAAATALYKATLMLSKFDPRKDPRTQGRELNDIRRLLTEKGYLK